MPHKEKRCLEILKQSECLYSQTARNKPSSCCPLSAEGSARLRDSVAQSRKASQLDRRLDYQRCSHRRATALQEQVVHQKGGPVRESSNRRGKRKDRSPRSQAMTGNCRYPGKAELGYTDPSLPFEPSVWGAKEVTHLHLILSQI